MSDLPSCPNCSSTYTYEDGNMFVCPECAHEWSQETGPASDGGLVITDANGNLYTAEVYNGRRIQKFTAQPSP